MSSASGKIEIKITMQSGKKRQLSDKTTQFFTAPNNSNITGINYNSKFFLARDFNPYLLVHICISTPVLAVGK